jgi:hypothetical protein
MNDSIQNISKLSLLFSLMVGVVFPEVILQENFNDNNLDGWTLSSAGVIEAENGELHISGGNDGFIHRISKFTDSYFTDFAFSADIGFVSGTGRMIGIGIGSNYNTNHTACSTHKTDICTECKICEITICKFTYPMDKSIISSRNVQFTIFSFNNSSGGKGPTI